MYRTLSIGIFLAFLSLSACTGKGGGEATETTPSSSIHPFIQKLNVALIERGFNETTVTNIGNEVGMELGSTVFLLGKGAVAGVGEANEISFITAAYMKRLRIFALSEKMELAATVIYELGSKNLPEDGAEVFRSQFIDLAKSAGIAEENIISKNLFGSTGSRNSTSASPNASPSPSPSQTPAAAGFSGPVAPSPTTSPSTTPAGAASGPVPSPPARDSKMPFVVITEQLDENKYEYRCLTTPQSTVTVSPECFDFLPFKEGATINTSRLVGDAFEGFFQQLRIRYEPIVFGSKFQVSVSQPPQGTCSLHQWVRNSAGSVVQERVDGNYYSGIADFSSDSKSLANGKLLNFEIRCETSVYETTTYYLSLSVKSTLDHLAGLVFSTDIPGPILVTSEILSDRRSLIPKSAYGNFFESGRPVTTDDGLVGALDQLPAPWKDNLFAFKGYGVVPGSTKIGGNLGSVYPLWLCNLPFTPSCEREIDYVVVVHPPVSYVFAKFSHSDGKYYPFKRFGSEHTCSYKGSDSRQSYPNRLHDCYFKDLEAQAAAEDLAHAAETVDTFVRFLPLFGGLYTAADLAWYQPPNQYNGTLSALVLVSSFAGPATALCQKGSAAFTTANALYWGAETLQAGISAYQTFTGNGGDYFIGISLLGFQGGRMALSKVLSVRVNLPQNSVPKSNRIIANGIGGSEVDVPADLVGEVNQQVGAVTNGKVKGTDVANKVRSQAGDPTEMEQIVIGNQTEQIQQARHRDISIVKPKEAKVCTMCQTRGLTDRLPQFDTTVTITNYDVDAQKAYLTVAQIRNVDPESISHNERIIMAQRQMEIRKIATEQGKDWRDPSVQVGINNDLTFTGVNYAGTNTVNSLNVLVNGVPSSESHALHWVFSNVITAIGPTNLARLNESGRIALIKPKLCSMYDCTGAEVDALAKNISNLISQLTDVLHPRVRSIVRTNPTPGTPIPDLTQSEAQTLVNAKAAAALNSTATTPQDAAEFYLNHLKSPVRCGDDSAEVVLVEYPSGSIGAVVSGEGEGFHIAQWIRSTLSPHDFVVRNEIVIATPPNGWRAGQPQKVQVLGRPMWLVKLTPIP